MLAASPIEDARLLKSLVCDVSPATDLADNGFRAHTAVVEIPYSSSTYSIKYRSSVNLKESGGNIHKNYNGWIQNLTRGINAQLTAS